MGACDLAGLGEKIRLVAFAGLDQPRIYALIWWITARLRNGVRQPLPLRRLVAEDARSS